MKTAEKRRSSRGPSTSQKKRKSEAVARDLEALEKEDVVEEEVPPLHDEIKLEQPHSVIFPWGVVHRVEIGWGLTKVAVVLLNGLIW